MAKYPQCVTVNVHRPRVKRIQRLDGGTLDITLGDAMNGSVAFLTDDADWHAVVREVARWLANEAKEKAGGSLYCDDCSFIARDDADLTEHMFGNHPATVAK